MGELPVNSQEYQHNLALFKFDIQKGSVISSRTQSIDLGLVFVLKVSILSICRNEYVSDLLLLERP